MGYVGGVEGFAVVWWEPDKGLYLVYRETIRQSKSVSSSTASGGRDWTITGHCSREGRVRCRHCSRSLRFHRHSTIPIVTTIHEGVVVCARHMFVYYCFAFWQVLRRVFQVRHHREAGSGFFHRNGDERLTESEVALCQSLHSIKPFMSTLKV